MEKVNQLLSARFRKKPTESNKTAALAQSTADGDRSSFAGIFGSATLDEATSSSLRILLEKHATEGQDLEEDFRALSALTSEVRAIHNQAALLHGERIKRVQALLKNYQEGAFSNWLVATYGNRQTPYNFLQYYEFIHSMPSKMRPQIEAMPRQAIYTLASREGDEEKKMQIVENYQGETKEEILHQIREAFPLSETDRRKMERGQSLLQILRKTHLALKRNHELTQGRLTPPQKKEAESLLKEIQKFILEEA